MHALISIHDVMPHTLAKVQDLLEKMSHLPAENISLLVVPGLAWTQAQTDTLHALEDRGYALAGHGWHHSTREIRGLYHRLHAALLSRRAAEHLSLGEKEINGLINDCYQWFAEKQFRLPDLYVPPAWAMGSVTRECLRNAPFRYFENTAGYYDSDNERQINLPLVGFEADNVVRMISLSLWNRANILLSSRNRPARISIHPSDGELLLSKSLYRTLQAVDSTSHYRSIW